MRLIRFYVCGRGIFLFDGRNSWLTYQRSVAYFNCHNRLCRVNTSKRKHVKRKKWNKTKAREGMSMSKHPYPICRRHPLFGLLSKMKFDLDRYLIMKMLKVGLPFVIFPSLFLFPWIHCAVKILHEDTLQLKVNWLRSFCLLT